MLQATHLLDDPVKLAGQSKTFVTKKKVRFSQNENNQAGQPTDVDCPSFTRQTVRSNTAEKLYE